MPLGSPVCTTSSTLPTPEWRDGHQLGRCRHGVKDDLAERDQLGPGEDEVVVHLVHLARPLTAASCDSTSSRLGMSRS